MQVASIQTLWVRSQHTGKMDLPPADLLVIDEAHHAPAKTYRKIIDAYPDAMLLGLTATPCRGDGRGLGGIFETMIECPQVAALIEQQYLVPTRCYAPVDPDLERRPHPGRRLRRDPARRAHGSPEAGRRHRHALAQVRRAPEDRRLRRQRRALASTSAMSSSSPACAPSTSTARRPSPSATQRSPGSPSGEIEVVTNCMVLTEGWDMPEVGCCILARPTKKMGLYRQMIGRVLRPAEGKADAIVLDHSGAVFRHGFVEDPVEWTLDPDRRAAQSGASRGGVRQHRHRACSNARNAALSASPASRAFIAGSCHSAPPRPVPDPSTAISASSIERTAARTATSTARRSANAGTPC